MSDRSLPAGTTLLLKGGLVLTPGADWHDPPQADIAIAGDKIIGIEADYEIETADVAVIDARDHLVLPGFVNAHYHSHDVLAKGTLEEVPLELWRLYALPPQYPPRSSEEVYARTLLGALECLRSGITTIQDMLTLYPYDDRHMEAVMTGLRRGRHPRRVRPAICRPQGHRNHSVLEGHFSGRTASAAVDGRRAGTPARSDRAFRADAAESSGTAAGVLALGPSAPERCSPELMRRTVELARRYDVPVYTHIYELRGMALQARLTLPEYSGLLIRRLAEEGTLDPRLNFAHSVWLSGAEIDLLAEHGAGVVLNPQGNLKMKCGIPPIRALQNAGVRIGLGCDNCSCSDAQNMFVAMKLFTLLAAVSDPIPGPPQAIAALRAATEAGADGARLGDSIGRIAPGFKADLTLIDTNDPTFSPMNSAARQLVHIEAGRGVRHVIVDGRVVVRDRKLTTIDETTIYEAIKTVMPDFRRDFTAISQRVAKLQPYLDRAHRQIMAAELDIERLPFGSN